MKMIRNKIMGIWGISRCLRRVKRKTEGNQLGVGRMVLINRQNQNLKRARNETLI